MLRILIITSFLIVSTRLFGQFIATVELKEPLELMCGENLYALFDGFYGQESAKCEITPEKIVSKINKECPSIKNDLTYKAKCVMSLYINCEGQVIQVDSEITDNPTLNDEINAVLLSTNGYWTPGKLNGEAVDCTELISIRIKKGVVYLD